MFLTHDPSLFLGYAFSQPHSFSIGGETGIRTRGPVKGTAFRVLSPSVNHMFSPVSFSQPCAPANPLAEKP